MSDALSDTVEHLAAELGKGIAETFATILAQALVQARAESAQEMRERCADAVQRVALAAEKEFGIEKSAWVQCGLTAIRTLPDVDPSA